MFLSFVSFSTQHILENIENMVKVEIEQFMLLESVASFGFLQLNKWPMLNVIDGVEKKFF